MFKVHR